MAKSLPLASMAFAGVLLGGVAIGALGSGNHPVVQADAQQIAIQAPRGAPLSFADLIERVSPAVVSVNVVTERQVGTRSDLEEFMERFRGMPGFEDFMERYQEEREEDEGDDDVLRQPGSALGSGFFITQDGHIVTNNHVIENATEISVQLEDGRELDAELIGKDPQTDLAVIKVIEPGDYQFVKFSESQNLRRGDWVVALGNPFGLGGTATAGILSADGRDGGNSSPYTDFLQIDAAINRGNSGGPTFDLYGRVIGVNTAILSPTGGSVGIGFAIPSELAIAVTDQLIANGKVSRGWLGVTIQPVTEDMADALDLAEAKGAIVNDLQTGGPAEKSGIERSDVIVEVNGIGIEDSTGLTREVAKLIAGTENDFVVIRDGVRRTVKVKVAERPEDTAAEFGRTNNPSEREDTDENDDGSEAELGLTLSALTDSDRSRLDLDSDEKGVVIVNVDRNSPLAPQGVVGGMAILEVNGRSVSSIESYNNAVDRARKQGKSNVLLAIRTPQGQTAFLAASLSEDEE